MFDQYFEDLDAMPFTGPCGEQNLILRGPDQQTQNEALILLAQRKGYQVAIHANGDLSLDKTLDYIEAAQQRYPQPDPRHQLIHLAFASPEQLARMQRLGMVTTVLINDLYYWGNVECTTVFGSDRMQSENYPVQSALQAGVSTALHSDAPVTEPDPLRSIWYAVKREPQAWPPGTPPPAAPCAAPLGQQNRVTIAQALHAYTVAAAYQYHLEDEIGTLEVGKRADLTILSANPLDVSNSHLDDLLAIKVVATVLGGRYLDDTFWAAYMAR